MAATRNAFAAYARKYSAPTTTIRAAGYRLRLDGRPATFRTADVAELATKQERPVAFTPVAAVANGDGLTMATREVFAPEHAGKAVAALAQTARELDGADGPTAAPATADKPVVTADA